MSLNFISKFSARHFFLIIFVSSLGFLFFSGCGLHFSGSTAISQNPLKNFSEFSSAVVINQSSQCGLDCVEKKKEFRYLAYVAEKIYCYWNEKQTQYQVDFKQKAIELENQISDSMDDTQYFLLLMKWASVFHDGHVNPMLKDDMSNLEFYSPAIRFELLAPATDHETLIVSQVSEDVQNLKIGTAVDKIQGQPWRDWMARAQGYAMGSTEAMRRKQMANLIFRALLNQEGPKPIRIEGSYKGTSVQEVVARNLSLYDGPSVQADDKESGIKLIKTTILDNNIGYLRVDGFSGEKMGSLLEQAMARFMGTQALLIDVRKNGGGDQSGNMILKHLSAKPLVRYKHRSIYSDFLLALRPEILTDFQYLGGLFTEFADRVVRPASQSSVYNKPVAVLTSANCFSACDTFVSALKENKLATVLGENTGGGTGTPQVFELPVSGHKFRYSVYQGITAVSQKMIEGVGTAADVVIEPTLADRVDKKDYQLEKALVWLAQQIPPTSPAPTPEPSPSPVPTPAQSPVPTSAVVLIPESLKNSVPDALNQSSLAPEVELDREIRKSIE